MKIALVHDWLISSIGGAENTLAEIYDLYPSTIYTLIWNKEPFKNAEIKASWIQKIPINRFRSFLPFFPIAIAQFDLSAYDLILSSSHCVAKGVQTNPNQIHICYCHTPMRYVWDLSEQYLKQANLNKGLKGWLARKMLAYLRNWDLAASKRVTHFIANSQFVADRIKMAYGRQSTVIYPPVDTLFYKLHKQKENYYITCSRLVSYKKIDLIVKAFTELPNLKLIVIGDGSEMPKLLKMATANISFLGSIPNTQLRSYLQKAKAFVFAAIEDFGITPVEAMSCGTPVIALKKGGAEETVIDHLTGLFFNEQSSEHIREAVMHFESMQFDPRIVSEHAAQFSKERFRLQFREFVTTKV